MARSKGGRQQTQRAQSRRERMREAAAKRRRNQNYMLIGAGAVILAVVAVIVGLNLRNSRPVAGEASFATQGNLHIEMGSVSPVAYNSTPPTSGPHYPTVAAWGYHSEPVRYEHLVHNLEDGGVVVYYQCEDECPELVESLRELLQPYFDNGSHVVLAPNDPSWTIGDSQPLHSDMGATIGVAAWRRLLLLDELDAEAILTFVDRYEGIDHHRG